MNKASSRIVKTYVSLTLLSTFASRFIWGINTLFLLDAGLSITKAFAANAFFTAGAVYAMQPYLLQLYGNTAGYPIAGLAASIVAGAQIVGGRSYSSSTKKPRAARSPRPTGSESFQPRAMCG